MKNKEFDIAAWRQEQRDALITARIAVSSQERARVAAEVADVLDELIDCSLAPTVSVYWPFRGELNLRNWMHSASQRGARIALPVVAAKAQPLEFRQWTPNCKMQKGIWNIPIPSDPVIVTPNVVISPLVGYDLECFRLGHGGGYYDRTLSAMATSPIIIGVGHPCSALRTIYPQSHDIPMDVIVTGKHAVRYRIKANDK